MMRAQLSSVVGAREGATWPDGPAKCSEASAGTYKTYLQAMTTDTRPLHPLVWRIEWITPPNKPSDRRNAGPRGRDSHGGVQGPPKLPQKPRNKVFLRWVGLALFHAPGVLLCAWFLPAVLAFIVLSWVGVTLLGAGEPGRQSRKVSSTVAAFIMVVMAYVHFWLKEYTWYGEYYHWMEEFLRWL